MKIVKVISVVDTREYEEQGDTFVPIPGSGNSNVCSRCTREHEIHWTVEIESGERAVVGGSCAKAGSLDPKLIQTAERQASREKSLTRELATYEVRLADLQRAIAEVAILPRPPITQGEFIAKSGEKIPTISMGDGGDVWCHIEGITEERKRYAETCWVSKRISERTQVKESVYGLKDRIDYTKKRLESARKKLSIFITKEAR